MQHMIPTCVLGTLCDLKPMALIFPLFCPHKALVICLSNLSGLKDSSGRTGSSR